MCPGSVTCMDRHCIKIICPGSFYAMGLTYYVKIVCPGGVTCLGQTLVPSND